ncbi:hypothetical protein GSI_01331 [Ganoderma sinense ZZ0214-1]|uniref:HNH nuclease domain-containing protein n=1 Tax=Ganoderma sinense ZZ0214-1 TaxID=1077348 RepID=A0A2G8SV36_9APHY|nr:hypothetical protein GSI_01331 [Ganoderma sinense ZZ0214-1]
MEPSDPVILVHAQLPTVRPGGPGYLDPSTWVWVPCLEFPIERVNELQFSSKPLKWIRYCIGAVTGTQGHLSHQADVLAIVDYDKPLSSKSESQSMALYYHVSDAEKEQMFPTDPHLADPPREDSVHSDGNTTTSSAPCRTFHEDLVERDECCVATRWQENVCDSVHLIPHCKGDDYIRMLTTSRSRGRAEDIVSSIDDVRNGILLHCGVHIVLRRTVAFLPLPNFAMNASDVVPGADPSEVMYPVHAFGPDYKDLLARARLTLPSPERTWAARNWPPPTVFEVVYGAAVLHEFGVPETFARVADAWEELYYPQGGWAASNDAYFAERHRARAEHDTPRQHCTVSGSTRSEAGCQVPVARPPDGLLPTGKTRDIPSAQHVTSGARDVQ